MLAMGREIGLGDRIGRQLADPAGRAFACPGGSIWPSMMKCATWMFFGASSRAMDWASPRRPNFGMAKPAEPGNPLMLAEAPVNRIEPEPRAKQPPRRLLADQEAAIGADQQGLLDRIGIEFGDRAACAAAGVEDGKCQRAGLVGGLEQACDGGRIGDVGFDGQRSGLLDQRRELAGVAGGQHHAKTLPW